MAPADALWRLPITRPEAWSPPPFDDPVEIKDVPSESADAGAAPAPRIESSEDDADMFPVLRDLPEDSDPDDESSSGAA